jgi:hypothetical protein
MLKSLFLKGYFVFLSTFFVARTSIRNVPGMFILSKIETKWFMQMFLGELCLYRMNAPDFSPFLNIPGMFRIEVLVTIKVDKNGRSGSFIENGQERLGRNERVENVHVFKKRKINCCTE